MHRILLTLAVLLGILAFPAQAQSPHLVHLPLLQRQPDVLALASPGGIVFIDADGGLIASVATPPVYGSQLSWSPDGQYLVFVRPTDPRPDGLSYTSLFTIRRDGSALRRITTGLYNDANPTWSPDGVSIVFDSDRSGVRNLFRVQADGNGLTQITDEPFDASHPNWSPDGAHLAFTRRDENGQRRIAVMEVDGSSIEDVPLRSSWQCFGPDWSPDGLQLASTCLEGLKASIKVSDLDGQNARTLITYQTVLSQITPVEPDWSPDGRRIVYSLRIMTGQTIHIINSDGTGDRSLFLEAPNAAWQP